MEALDWRELEITKNYNYSLAVGGLCQLVELQFTFMLVQIHRRRYSVQVFSFFVFYNIMMTA